MRFRARSTKTLSSHIKTRPVKGRGDEAGRYYRCNHCGFVCDKERDTLKGANATAGNGALNVTTVSDPTTANLNIGIGGDLNFFHTAMEAGSDGLAKTVYHAFEPTVDHGCPFCGTTNWKG